MARRQRGNARGRRGRNEPDTFSVEGVVEEISSRKWGKSTLYNVEMDDGDTYGFGRELEDVEEGDTIRFEAYENDKGYLTKQDDTVELVEEDSGSRDSGSRERSRGGKGRGKAKRNGRQNGSQKQQDGKSDKDNKRRSKESIQYSEARNRAVSILNFLVREEMVKLGAKNKPQERETAYWGMLDQLTAQEYEEIESLAALGRAADARSGGSDDPEDEGDPDDRYDD